MPPLKRQQTAAAGGKKAASKMTPEERAERARKAAEARWGREEAAVTSPRIES
jgi:hypothetical protein